MVHGNGIADDLPDAGRIVGQRIAQVERKGVAEKVEVLDVERFVETELGLISLYHGLNAVLAQSSAGG